MAGNELDKEFIEQQRDRLLDRKAELERMQRDAQEVSRERSQEYQDAQADSGDESQYLFEREVDATLGQQFGQELKDVSRALEKIEEGTYGLSDRSGEPIPRGRLEAIPEALYTIEEQQRREGERRPPV
ncbi:MAG TPA: TraR/DksA C4-type zinc finger protein [Rubrobacteraceae bacterium]|nr:TraR/DksA C4-type zinc finger protein [Rubrobacteraceae bacterium]